MSDCTGKTYACMWCGGVLADAPHLRCLEAMEREDWIEYIVEKARTTGILDGLRVA